MSALFNVVLVEPEIPNNTGNIGRTCVGTNSRLHLIEPLGFEINDKQLRRAGLDYWPYLDVKTHASIDEWRQEVPDWSRVFFFTTKSNKAYFDVDFQPGDWFVFGKETKGLDEGWLKENQEQALTLPMLGSGGGNIRSHNLANTVSVVLYEGLRQNRAHLGL